MDAPSTSKGVKRKRCDGNTKSAISNDPCFICNKKEVNDIMYGPFLDQKDIRCHYFCLLFCWELTANGCDIKDMAGYRVEDIKAVMAKVKGRKSKNCCYCKGEYATAVCHDLKCKKYFHVPCGMKNNALFHFFGEFECFCDKDAKNMIQHNEKPKEDQKCGICLDLLGEYDPVSCFQPQCCIEEVKEKEPGTIYWFHYKCAMQGTRTLGYYFNCFAYCCAKTDDDAKQGYLDRGIFIPKRDALYEDGKNYKGIDKKIKLAKFETTYEQDATLLHKTLNVVEEVACDYVRRCIGRKYGKNDYNECAMEGCDNFAHIKCLRYYRDIKNNDEARKEKFFCKDCTANSCLARI